MRRFDALTQIEESPLKPVHIPPTPPSPQETQNQIGKTKSDGKKPANMQTRKHENRQTDKHDANTDSPKPKESPEKYSTRLEPSMVKKIKVYAAEKDIKY